MNSKDLFALDSAYKYKRLGTQYVLYNLETADTLLIDDEAAGILTFFTDKPISLAQLQGEFDSSGDTQSFVEDTFNVLIEKGLLNKAT